MKAIHPSRIHWAAWFVAVVCVAAESPLLAAGMYDDFETDAGNTFPDVNGIEGTRWTTINPNWIRQKIHGSNRARSANGGETTTGSLISAAIAVNPDELLQIDVDGFRGTGGPHSKVSFSDSVINRVHIRSGSAAGPILATIVPQGDPPRVYRVDARGASLLFVDSFDGDTNGAFAWIAIDNVQTIAGTENTEIPNGSFESGFSTWTQTGTAWEALRVHGGDSGDRAFEGGVFATTVDNGAASSTLRSGPIVVDHDTLTFAAAGFTGASQNLYRLLDENFVPIVGAVAFPPNSTAWTTLSFDLPTLGVAPSSTIYLEAVDNSTTYLALDWVRLTGEDFIFVPEPSTIMLLGLGAIGLAIKARRRRQAA